MTTNGTDAIRSSFDVEPHRVLSVGIIGYGNRAVLARLPQNSALPFEVTAICDTEDVRLSTASADFPDALITNDVDALLASDVDAVMVLTPDSTHAALAIAALEAGKTVFCEKPLATTVEDCDAILRTAAETGSRLYVGHNMRHMPVVVQMRELIEAGRIGEVKAIWCRHFVGNGGDYYFKDWHADRANTTGLLLQKGAHDIDVIHWLANGFTRRVAAMGKLAVYGGITDRRDRSGERVDDWFSVDNWPPAAQTGLHPTVNVEDISMMNMELDNGALASYQQCHFTPDYWRNYTVIGTEGRLENEGDTVGGTIKLWTTRHDGYAKPDEEFVIGGEETIGHGGADPILIAEFIRFARDGGTTQTSPVAAREAVAAGYLATESLRSGSGALEVPSLPERLVRYFAEGQHNY